MGLQELSQDGPRQDPTHPRFAHAGVDVLISDIDVAWLRDPIPLFRRYPQADILVSTDQLRSEILVDPAKQTRISRQTAKASSSTRATRR